MHKIISILLITTCLSFTTKKPNIFHFKTLSIDGGKINFRDFKGKKILIVNTASLCGYTYQYEGLQKLADMYSHKLVVVAFPSNNFKNQEPGSNAEIQDFCQKNYKVNFTLGAKLDVVGETMHPLFFWLTHKSKNGTMDAEINWNFNKFLLNEKGELLEHFNNKVEPTSTQITKYFQ